MRDQFAGTYAAIFQFGDRIRVCWEFRRDVYGNFFSDRERGLHRNRKIPVAHERSSNRDACHDRGTLQQGAAVLDPATGLSKPSNIAIGGSIRVQGFPCFTSGTANTTLFGPSKEPLSSIAGNIMRVSFTMDNGSMLNLTGALTDATESHISALFSVNPFVQGCGAGSSIVPVVDLTRQ